MQTCARGYAAGKHTRLGYPRATIEIELAGGGVRVRGVQDSGRKDAAALPQLRRGQRWGGPAGMHTRPHRG